MFKSGFILTAILSTHTFAAATPRASLGVASLSLPAPASCALELERNEALRLAVEALQVGDEPTAYMEATMLRPDSPVLQATLLDEKKITNDTARDMRAHGYSLAIDTDSNQLILIHDQKRAHRFSLHQPIAEVRFHETADLRLELALVGWISTEYFILDRAKVTRTISPSEAVRVPRTWLEITPSIARILDVPFDERLAADRNSDAYAEIFHQIHGRGVRGSPWVPARPHADRTEEAARLHRLSLKPKPETSYLHQAVAQLVVETLSRARAICERRHLEGSMLSDLYPNSLLGLAADRVRSNHELLEDIARVINRSGEGVVGSVHATVMPRGEEDPLNDDGRPLMTIKFLGCSPLVFSVPPDPISGARGWGVLTGHS